jgi:23S rRNA (uracil1939-C5)-methyltransferase
MSGTATSLVQIEKPVYGGEFLARVDGKAVFVPMVLPGEQIRIRMVDEKQGYAKAETEAIVVNSAQRVSPRCPYFGACGGCDYQHTDYETQIGLKKEILRETLERAQVRAPDEFAVLAAEPWNYRNRIRVALDANGDVGYRGRRSHGIVPISACPIAAPLLVKAALAAAEVFRTLATVQWPAEISLFCNPDESALLATIVAGQPAKARAEDFAQRMSERIPELVGVEFVTEGLPGRQPKTVARWGATSLTYRAAGFDYRVDHGAFFQVNRLLVDALVNRVTETARGALAWDLFAGVGLFARKLADHFDRVIAVESASAATAALEHNLNGTSGEAVFADALAFLRRSGKKRKPELVVVDPPRTGLGKQITALLAEVGAPGLVYVSCDPATLARDLRPLIESGYVIDSMTLADLFPQTFHLETVVRMRRT